MLEPIPSSQVHEALQERLKEFLLTSGLKPTEQLPSEHELSSQLNTSRSAIREALRSLEALGMIEVKRGKGRYLRKFSFDSLTENLAYSLILDATSISDLLAVRCSLELTFLSEAATALTDSDLANLQNIVGQMRAKAELDETFITEDMAFHKVLFSRVPNALLKKLLDVFWQLFSEVHSKNVLPAGKTTTTVEYHAQILAAIQGGEFEVAESLLRDHFEDVRQRLVKARDPVF